MRLVIHEKPPAANESVAQRIAWHRAQLAALEHQQREDLIGSIAAVVGAGVAFSAKELFAHRRISPALASAFDDARITSAKQLGKKLRQLGLTRVGEDRDGALWTVDAG